MSNIIKKELYKDADDEEMKKLLDFSSSLVILDKVTANSLETSKSVYAASDYLVAFYNLEDRFTELDRSKILENYVELNPYYAKLQQNYAIEPGVAREGKHLTILKARSNSLSSYEEELFYTCYYDSLNYYTGVIGTKAFDFHKDYGTFTKMFIIWSTIQKYITNKMDVLFNIDFYDKRTLKNSFISLGLDYFDGMPMDYQRKLLKKMNEIISNKGSTQCYIDIMEVFGKDTVQISNFYLVKRYAKSVDPTGKEIYTPTLEFYKTPFTQQLNMKSDEYFSFDEITMTDKYWKATQEEILNKDFNVIQTNYISVNSAINITKNSLKLSYFFNFLEKAYANNLIDNLSINNLSISPLPFNMYHAIIALMALGMKINGYKDNIIKNEDISNYVYGYANPSDGVNLDSFIINIKDELDKDTQMNELDKSALMNFINKFSVDKLEKNIENNNTYSLKEFLDAFYSNEDIRNSLERFISISTNYEIVQNLRKIKDLEMRVSVNTKVFEGYKTYSEYLTYADVNLYNYTNIDDIQPDNEADLYLLIKEKMNELIVAINSQLYNYDLTESFSRNTFMGLNNYLEYYIKTVILLFKPYSAELLDTSNILELNDSLESVRLYDHFDKTLIKSEADYIGLNEKLEILNGEGVNIL